MEIQCLNEIQVLAKQIQNIRHGFGVWRAGVSGKGHAQHAIVGANGSAAVRQAGRPGAVHAGLLDRRAARIELARSGQERGGRFPPETIPPTIESTVGMVLPSID